MADHEAEVIVFPDSFFAEFLVSLMAHVVDFDDGGSLSLWKHFVYVAVVVGGGGGGGDDGEW